MKCPHCEYEDGWNAELMDNVHGDSGRFYRSVVEMKRENGLSHYMRYQTKSLFGCPKCNLTFMGEEF